MLELVYPVEIPAPRLGDDRPVGACEIFPVVETSGLVTGQASRTVCHGGSKYLHPVVHLHIIDREGRIYLQQRSANKDLLPLCWDTAVGGHVSYGEQIREALYREASEELGLYDFNPIGIMDYVFESAVEKELVCVFAAVGSFDPKPDNYEVCDGRYWTRREISRAMGKGILTPNFEKEYKMVKDKLLSLL